MGTIVAIGGGSIKDLETLVIDRYIVGLVNKKSPKALFIPTASGDAQEYIDVFNDVYGKELGCVTDALLLMNENLSEQEIKDIILSSDIIYVGGGSTSKMLDIWREYNVDKYLKQAYEKGIILSGLSAGSICWFKYGYSDSRSTDGIMNYRCLEALGLINAIYCPHYDEEGRKGFDEMIEPMKKIGIALENNCAIVFKDDTFRIVKSTEKASAYKLVYTQGKVQKHTLTNKDFISNTELYD